MYNLPLVCMCEAMGLQLGNSMGVVQEVKTKEDGVGWGEYLQVRVSLDITKPLARGRFLKLNEAHTWVAFQYEKLPKFCFHCGIIRHGPMGFIIKRGGQHPGDTSKVQFGSWLRASPGFFRSNFGRGWSDKVGMAVSLVHGSSIESGSNAVDGSRQNFKQQRVGEPSEVFTTSPHRVVPSGGDRMEEERVDKIPSAVGVFEVGISPKAVEGEISGTDSL